MTHFIPCITNELRDMHPCLDTDHTPRAATRGEVCERCYQRIDQALQTADHLRTQLTGVARAITPEVTNTVPGPRVPLTALRLALDEIDRYQQGHVDPASWVQTEVGAISAVRFARAVHNAERAHPTTAAIRKLQRLRCPNCSRVTAVVRPPDWYGDDTTISCIACGWEATNPDALDIATHIEAQGPIDLLKLALRYRRGAA